MTSKTSQILFFVFWGLVFALAYAQSPLYTSNQNQYFLHGLAQAGFGDLDRDWLANTTDPTLVFSWIVSLIYRYLRWEGIFYILFALLMGVYLFSLEGIASQIFNVRASATRRLIFLALLVALHAAGLRFALSRVIGVNWTYIFEDGVADQRLLGPVLQPSAFGVLLLLSIYLFLKDRHLLAILAALVAAAVHPTYLLSAAALTGSYVLVITIERRNIRYALALGLLALLAAVPILAAVVPVFASGPGSVAERARQILVDYRIPHHAMMSWWLDATVLVKLLIMLVAIYLVRRTRLFLVMIVCLLVAVSLSLLQIILDSNSLALLFPWRLSTFLLPLSTALVLAYLVDRLFALPIMMSPTAQKALQIVGVGLVLLAVSAGILRFALDLQRKASDPERLVQAYVADQRHPEDVYLTPVKMQDFRLETGAAVFVDFKSIPYRPDEVLEWYHREQLADRFYKTGKCAVLDEILEEYPLTHVLTEAGEGQVSCSHLELIYRDDHYQLWRIQ